MDKSRWNHFWLFWLLFVSTSSGIFINPDRETVEKYLLSLPRTDYANHHLFQITARNVDDLNLLKLWRTRYAHLKLDFWDDSLPTYFSSQNRNTNFLVRVAPEFAGEFIAVLTDAELLFQVLSRDLKRLIQWEKSSVSDLHLHHYQHRALTASQETITTGRYQSHNRILLPGIQTLSAYLSLESVYEFIDSIVSRYPLLASSFDIGRTYQGRPIRGIKIGAQFPLFKDTDYDEPQIAPGAIKRMVLLDGAMQGRDWLSVPTLLYLTQQLLAKYDVDSDSRLLLDFYDWYIIPVANPDGYNYSWTTDRFWRKTRSVSATNSTVHSDCRGVDLNRNFGVDWGQTNDPHANLDDVCQKYFAGDRAFSERESTALAKFMYNHRQEIVVYGTLQHFGQNILFPYAGRESRPAGGGDGQDLILAARLAATAMHRVHGVDYGIGSFAENLYDAGGSSLDWAYDVAKIKHSYQFQLRDNGYWGFLLPRNQIIPAAAEFFAGITELVRFVHVYEKTVEM